jgi:hypothetical protein
MKEKERMEYPRCIICLQKCIVPVEITCFPCSAQPHSKNCMSFRRFCYECAVEYLSLGVSCKKTIKCILFDARVDAYTLHHETAFRIDYMLMQLDTSLNTCPYCAEYEGVQLDVHKHMMNECQKRFYFCACRERVSLEQKKEHEQTCSLYCFCQRCREPVLKHLYNHHLFTAHNIVQCYQCKESFHCSLMTQHQENICLFRRIPCTICSENIVLIQLTRHLQNHQTEMLEHLTRTTKLVLHYSTLLQNLYEQIEQYKVSI